MRKIVKILWLIIAGSLLFSCEKHTVVDVNTNNKTQNVANEEDKNNLRDETKKIKATKDNIEPIIEPLKQYVSELFILNYGNEWASELKYRNYKYEIISSGGGGGWYYSGPSSILTFAYTIKNKNIKVEFYDAEQMDYIYRDGNEYKFEKYLPPKVIFDESTTGEDIKFVTGSDSIYDIEKFYIDENKSFKTNNRNKKLKKVNNIKIGDKILYGKFAGNNLIWTVANKEKNRIELISDYTFDFNLDYRNIIYNDTFYIRSLFTKDEYDKIEALRDEQSVPYKFYILDEDKYENVFKSNEERKVYGCFGDTKIMGEKCYYVGKKGLYYESVNAVDGEGNFYPAYDMSSLPNRICMQVVADEVMSIDKDNYEPIDFSFVEEIKENMFKNSYAGNYERVSATYIDNKIIPKHHMNGFSNKLVRIGNDIKYVDMNHNIHEIKTLEKDNEDLRVGDIIYFGNTKLHYKIEAEDDKYIDGREIDEDKKMVFRIMEIKGGVATIHSLFSVSDNGNTVSKTGYIDSSLREYLNNDFLNNSFNEYEKSIIVPTEISYYDYNDRKDKVFTDKIWTLKNDIWMKYYENMNTENYILKPYALENEYIYMTDLSDEKRIDENKNIKYILYVKNRPVWFMADHASVTLGWSGLSADGEKDTGFLPMLNIKIYEENITNVNDYYLPEFEYDNFIERAVINDNDLYFMDFDNTLFLLRDYKGEAKVDKKNIIEIAKKVGMLYKKDDDVYIFSNLNWRDNWNEEEGVLYLSNKKVDKVQLADSVFARLFFRENAVEFYVDGKIRKGSIDGKKYVLEDYILTDDNGKSKNIISGEKLIEGKEESEEIIKNYNTIVVDRDRKKFKIKNKIDKFVIIPYVKNASLYINYNDENIEIDKIENDGSYEKPLFYYIDKYDAYYIIYSREKTEKTTLRYLYMENDNIVIETLDEVNCEITKKLIYDGVFYYQRIPENGWAPDISTLYSVEQNENPKEIKYERLSKYYYFNPRNGSEFFLNSSGDIVEIDKYGNRKIIEEYISDLKFIPNGVIYSKKIDNDFKVFYYDLNKKYEIGYGNELKELSKIEAKDFYITGDDVRVFKLKHLFVFDEKIIKSSIDDLALEKERFYKEVYDYLENVKEYIYIYDLYHIDENLAEKIDGEVGKTVTCGDNYILYVKKNTLDFVKPIDKIYEMLKSINISYIKSAKSFVEGYKEYMSKNAKEELYLYGNGKKHKIVFNTDIPKSFPNIITSKVKNNELLISFNGNMYCIVIEDKNELSAKYIDDKVTHIIYTYNDGTVILTKVKEPENIYDICSYKNGEVEVIKSDIKLYGDLGETDVYKIFGNELNDQVYAIQTYSDNKKKLISILDEKSFADGVEDSCSIVYP